MIKIVRTKTLKKARGYFVLVLLKEETPDAIYYGNLETVASCLNRKEAYSFIRTQRKLDFSEKFTWGDTVENLELLPKTDEPNKVFKRLNAIAK